MATMIQKLRNIAKKNSNIRVFQDKNGDVVLQTRDLDSYIEYMRFIKAEQVVEYMPNYKNLTNEGDTVEDILNLVSKLNDAFETDFKVKNLISPHEWSQATGFIDAYADPRYTSVP